MAEKSAYEARLAVSVTGGGMTERPDRQNVPNRYRRIGLQELSARLDRLGLTAGQFARLASTQRKRVLQWLHPDDTKGEDIPHATHVLLALMLADPENLNRALALADEYIVKENAE
jgi:hypothetical protein